MTWLIIQTRISALVRGEASVPAGDIPQATGDASLKGTLTRVSFPLLHLTLTIDNCQSGGCYGIIFSSNITVSPTVCYVGNYGVCRVRTASCTDKWTILIEVDINGVVPYIYFT